MKTLEEIRKIREEKRRELDLRVNMNASTKEKHILVCHGTGCTSSKSPKIIENFRKILEEKNIDNVRVIQTGCFGLCAKGPIVIIRPEDTFYAMVTPDDCEEIINTHIIEGKTVERLLCKDIGNQVVNSLDELAFNMRLIKRRNKVVLYLKKSDLISSFLVLIGAVESCLNFENTRVERDFANIDNRMFNLDGANYGKTIATSKKQIEDIFWAKGYRNHNGKDHKRDPCLRVFFIQLHPFNGLGLICCTIGSCTFHSVFSRVR